MTGRRGAVEQRAVDCGSPVVSRWGSPALIWCGDLAGTETHWVSTFLSEYGGSSFCCYESLASSGVISTAQDHAGVVVEHRRTLGEFWRDANTGRQVVPWQMRIRFRDHPELDSVYDDMRSRYRPCLPGEPRSEFSALWVAGAGSRTPLHQDAGNGVLVQLAGEKFAHLVHPHGISVDDLEALRTADRRPGDEQAARMAALPAYFGVRLPPGCALYIPRGWYHEIECLSASVSLVLRE